MVPVLTQLPTLQGQHISQGTPIKSGTVLRLQHMATNKWLHSHDFPSPLTNKHEVKLWLC